MTTMAIAKEKAILVGLDRGQQNEYFAKSIEELKLLADTAGANVACQVTQKRDTPDSAFYIGPGKAKEVAVIAEELSADLVIFNDELSPSQIRNLDRVINRKVIDRSALILDIFANRARSREGRLQVELAQMNYLLPRLTGLGNILSRLGGGIGTRGPGETKLEVDRRVIRRRISDLKKEINVIRKQRTLHRQRRSRNRCAVVSLVGYTNAGKSTLLNALTGADLYTEDKVFATLDPATRRGIMEGGREILFTDTVGFIEKLPRQLVTAFKATLEEIEDANLLIHVVDLSHPDYLNHIKTVRKHLKNIDLQAETRELLVFNKIDLLAEKGEIKFLEREFPEAIFISALTGEGMEELRKKTELLLSGAGMRMKIYLPYKEGRLYAMLQERARIDYLEYKSDYLELTVTVERELADKLITFTELPNGSTAAKKDKTDHENQEN